MFLITQQNQTWGINPQHLAYLQINYLENFWMLSIDEQQLGE
jgi:hypothetical protein